MCDGLAPCCAAGMHPYDRDACMQGIAVGVRDAYPKGAGFDFDGQKAQACLALARESYGKCKKLPKDAREICNRIAIGKRKPGESCTTSAECEDPVDGSATCTKGACAAEKRGKAGEACHMTCQEIPGSLPFCVTDKAPSGLAVQCWVEDGLQCGPDGTCGPAKKAGEACDVNDCDTKSYCKGTTCTVKAALGEGCTAVDGCQGAYCDVQKGSCLAWKKADDVCGAGIECEPPLGCNLVGGKATCGPTDVLRPDAELCGG